MNLFTKKRKPILDLRDFIHSLQAHNELCIIDTEVDPHLEIAEIHRRVVHEGGPALLFRTVKGSSFSVATNLFGSERRMELAFPDSPEKWVSDMIKLATGKHPPEFSDLWKNRSHLQRLLHLGTKKVKNSPLLECQMHDLEKLPILKCWPEDGGHFITLPLVYTEPVDQHPTERGAPNLGMYRIQRFDKKTTGLHFQIGKGGGFHYGHAEWLGKNLPITIFLGGPPALILSAIAPLPENVPELVLASLLQGSKLDVSYDASHPHPLISRAEFALLGHAKPNVRRLEGPFGDHYGYYGLAHEFPVFRCDKIYHRKEAIYPATVVGKPIQEDLFIGNYLQKLLSPLIPVVMPGVKELWSYAETGFHALASAIVKERYEKEALSSAFRILGEGQLALTKFLLVTDQNVDLSDIKMVLETILVRFRPQTDLRIFTDTSYDTLDYTGPKLNRGSKACLLGLGQEKRKLAGSFSGTLPAPLTKAKAFCKGCLLLQGPQYIEFSDPFKIIHSAAPAQFEGFPLLILVDDIELSASSALEFLWTVFTRFEPAGDIYCKSQTNRHHISYELPILIDARMKPSYPKECKADRQTIELVDQKWTSYGISL